MAFRCKGNATPIEALQSYEIGSEALLVNLVQKRALHPSLNTTAMHPTWQLSQITDDNHGRASASHAAREFTDLSGFVKNPRL